MSDFKRFPKSNAYTLTDLKDNKTWLRWRQTGIGGSDAAIVAGLSPFGKTPYDLWYSKTRKPTEVKDNNSNYILERGHALEPAIRTWFAQQNLGITVLDGTLVGLESTKWPFMHASLDGVILDPAEKTPGVLEIKSMTASGTSRWYAPDGEKDIPTIYKMQLAQYLLVTGWAWGVVVADFNRGTPEVFRFTREEMPLKGLPEMEKRFWHDVETKTAPKAHASDIAKIFPKDDGATVKASPRDADALAKAASDYAAARRDMLAARDRMDGAKARLVLAVGAHRAVTFGAWTASYKTVERAAHMVKASSSRVFRLKEAGK